MTHYQISFLFATQARCQPDIQADENGYLRENPFEEGRQFFRFRTTMQQHVSLADQRRLFRQRLDALKAMVLVA